eukprot:CAMPEP_0180620448 /NCGR_PEP_ID=MMETSP1037_2-20121125/34616_1 /TAXON_ID=632150 /ORGANISM="Azadinium spinosum, Strain 3D9" /LENGTH=366 /DNA_ID=CAMNT_0022640549 /DNA_START=335 /DNA_END=1432 /DNA_ORIENTATION=+
MTTLGQATNVIYGYSGQWMYFELMETMEEPHRFPRAFAIVGPVTKQRRAGGGKHKAPGDTVEAACAVAPALATAPAGGAGAAADEDEVKQLLQDFFGDWEKPPPPSEDMRAFGGDASALQSALHAGHAAMAAMTAPAPGGIGPRRGVKKTTPLVVASPSACSAGHEVFSTSAAAVMHRLIEPAQVLSAGLTEDDEAKDEEGLGEEPAFLDEAEIGGGWIPHLGQDLPGQFQIEHRLPRTFHESMENMEVERREVEIGGGWIPPFGQYLPGQFLKQQRLPRSFHESMENIAVERRESFNTSVDLHGRIWGDFPSSGASARLTAGRARTFNEGFRNQYPSPIATPARPFIRTPTWTSADSGEIVGEFV